MSGEDNRRRIWPPPGDRLEHPQSINPARQVQVEDGQVKGGGTQRLERFLAAGDRRYDMTVAPQCFTYEKPNCFVVIYDERSDRLSHENILHRTIVSTIC